VGKANGSRECAPDDRLRVPTVQSTFLNDAAGLPQPIDFLDQQIARTVGKNDREKEDTAFEICATIVGHDASYHA